jgi:ABC-type branched-subunit amino acid transport system ATPase component
MQSSSSSLLSIRQLKKSFGGVHAIRGVDLDVSEGEIVGVIGPNGSGKTTTFNVITGLIRADGGNIFWKSQACDLVSQKPWSIFGHGIARTFQNIRLPLGLTVLENIMVGLYLQQEANWLDVIVGRKKVWKQDQTARDRAFEAIQFVSPPLAKAPDRLVAELAYPDRRRVEIARAIVSQPKMLLLDEPTAGMNPRETEELADDILKINENGITVLLVEHKMKFVSALAKRVAVLNFGQKIAEGSYEEIRSDAAVVEAYLGRRRSQ